MVDPNALVGTLIDGRYQLASVVGTGAFGTVFAADEMAFGRVVGQVAVKLVRPLDDHARDAIAREVQAMAQLSHSHLLTYRAAGEVREGLAKGCLFIATELASGTLADRLARPERMTVDETLVVARHLASALVYLHGRQAIHRDVKPANLLKVGDIWKLGDFGLVQGFVGTSMQGTGRKGTILYMSPEAMGGECGPFGDVWALGVVVQECLTGTYPYSGGTDVEVIGAALSGEPAIAEGLPDPFGALVGRCLARDRTQRPGAQGVLEMLDRRPTVRQVPPETLRGHTKRVDTLAFSPDGRYLLSGSNDGSALLWDVADRRQLRVCLRDGGAVHSVAFSGDGSMAVAGTSGRSARVWRVPAGPEICALNDACAGVTAVAFGPDSAVMATAGLDHVARLWSVPEGRHLWTFEGHTRPIWSVAFSPDGATVLTGGRDRSARLWSLETGGLVHVLSGHSGCVNSVAFAPDGARCLTASWDATVRIWDVASGRQVCVLSGHTDAVNSVACSSDGRVMVTGSDDGSVCLWEMSTGRLTGQMRNHSTQVCSVAVSPDGKLVASAGADGVILLWDPETIGSEVN